MVSEIAKRREIDKILSPSIEQANKLATELKARSDVINAKLIETKALLLANRAKRAKEARITRLGKVKLKRPRF